ncbi:MAG: ABC transporter ATP-binding protein [Gammaproteobacteria bacterium]
MNVLEARSLGVTRGARSVLDSIDLQLACGEFVGLIGPNGAGKTTLLRALAGLEPLAAGSVHYDGTPLAALAASARARWCGYHAQAPELHWPLAVATIVALGRLPHGARPERLGEADRAAVARALARTELDALAARAGDTLSGGELARVHIARLLAGEHRVLLADEPIANLDPRYQLAIMGLLAEHAAGGGAVAVVLHDLAIAARYCDRLLLLDAGHIVAAGPPQAVLTPVQVARTFGVGEDYLASSGVMHALAQRTA